jgi:hypothetical protein
MKDPLNACDASVDTVTGGPGTDDRAKVNRNLDDVEGVEHVTKC